jgi:hypothetical protein
MSKFKALQEILEAAVPAAGREAEEAAAREAFKSEFNLPVAHGTSLEKIAKKQYITNDKWNPITEEYETIPYSKLVEPIKEFSPNDSFNGKGIFTAPYEKNMESGMGPNYKFSQYARGEGSHVYPLVLRGDKTFRLGGSWFDDAERVMPSVEQSFNKLSELTKIPVDELRKKDIWEIEKLIQKYPESFENFAFDGQIKTYNPKNIRSPFAEFDPAKKDSGDFMAGLGAATAGAYALSPEEAKAEALKELSESKKYYKPTEEGDLNPSLPPDAFLRQILNKTIGDEKAPPEFSEKGGGITEPLISPLDFPAEIATMAGVGAKGLVKGAMAGRKALYKTVPMLASERGELDIDILRNLLSLKNPKKEDVLKAIDYRPPSTYKDVEREREKLSDALSAAAKERTGIPQGTENEEATRQILKLMHPEIEATKLPLEINPNSSSSYLGQFVYNHPIIYPEVSEPLKIILRDTKPSTGIHEAQHFREKLTNPYSRTSEELLGFLPETTIEEALGAQKSGYLINKLKTLNPEIKEEQISKELNEIIQNINQDSALTTQQKMIKLGEVVKNLSGNLDPLELISARHFTQYPRNFEMQKIAELLSPDTALSTPDLTENNKIIRDIFKQFQSGDLKRRSISETSKAIQDEYIKQNFPNIKQILKNK